MIILKILKIHFNGPVLPHLDSMEPEMNAHKRAETLISSIFDKYFPHHAPQVSLWHRYNFDSF